MDETVSLDLIEGNIRDNIREMLKCVYTHTDELPVTVGAITTPGCLPPGFTSAPRQHPPHTSQQGAGRAVYRTYSKTLTIIFLPPINYQ